MHVQMHGLLRASHRPQHPPELKLGKRGLFRGRLRSFRWSSVTRLKFDHRFPHDHRVVMPDDHLRARDLRVAGRQRAEDEVRAGQAEAEFAGPHVQRDGHHDEFLPGAVFIGGVEDDLAGRNNGGVPFEAFLGGDGVSLRPGGDDARTPGATGKDESQGQCGQGGDAMHAAVFRASVARLPSPILRLCLPGGRICRRFEPGLRKFGAAHAGAPAGRFAAVLARPAALECAAPAAASRHCFGRSAG